MDIITYQEAAEILGVDPCQVGKYARAGLLGKIVKLDGRTPRIERTSAEKFIRPPRGRPKSKIEK